MPLLFVAGYGSGAGKSTTCASLLAYARTVMSVPSSELAYIKPATQCETPTDVTAYCEEAGIEAVGLGPVVFRKGFTNSVIGDDDYTARADELLASAIEAVRDLERRKKFVLVDGVGYPSVGSCCGIGNGKLAAALGSPVLLIGPAGLGDCIDTFDLMITYFRAKGATVLGAVVNKAADSERHRLAETIPLVQKWFVTQYPEVAFIGAMPEVRRLSDANEVLSPSDFVGRLLDTARQHLDLDKVLASLK